MTNTRACAAQILAEIFNQKNSLNQVLAEKVAGVTHTANRGFIQELCYGTLRWYHQLNAISQILLKQPLKSKDSDIHALVLIGFYQLLHLKTAPHAAIHETVQATRDLKKPWATGLINGVLRALQRNEAGLLQKINQAPSAQYSHPQWLLKALQQAWPEQWQTIVTANNQHPPLTLRVNRLKYTSEEYLQLLQQHTIAAQATQYTTHGITLAEACDVKKLPGFAEGAISVQDGAAQLAAELLDLRPGLRVLDACAAPGGKTAHILETEPNLSELVIIDIDERRLQKIEENLKRLGLYKHQQDYMRLDEDRTLQGCKASAYREVPVRIQSHVSLLMHCADAAQPEQWWDKKLFDRILLDAPCSATGVIRRHPDIKLLRRAEDIPTLAALQQNLLNKLWPLLKSGGLLVYATCSLLPQENSQVLENFLTTHPDAQEKTLNVDWGIKTNIGRQIFPELNGMDGFYYGCLTKM